MFKKKYIGAALAGALALTAWSSAALSTPVNVDGVTWDTDSAFNLTIQSLNLRESAVSKKGDVLMGYGQIGSINTKNDFCIDCDLTFTFTYTVSNVTGNQIVFDKGSFQFYVAPAHSYDAGNPATASAGSAWVTLTGHASANPAFGTQGQLYSTVVGTASNPQSGSNGFGLVDATGGDAASYLNIYKIADGMGGFGNLALNSSFLFFPANNCAAVTADVADICHYPIEGNGSLVGKLPSTNVPEPGPAGILGVGLAVIGLLLGRRRKEAEGRA